MKPKRIKKVEFDNNKKIMTVYYKDGQVIELEYSKFKIKGKIQSVGVDKETDGASFYYKSTDGYEEFLSYDAPLISISDPVYLYELRMEYLVSELKDRINSCNIPKRLLAKMLHTSESQLYRLLDPNRAVKNFQQLFKLASFIGLQIEIKLKEAA